MKLVDVNVSLEGVGTMYFKSLVADDLLNAAAHERDERLGRCEVEIHQRGRARRYHRPSDDMFTRAPLMAREKVFHAEDILQYRL